MFTHVPPEMAAHSAFPFIIYISTKSAFSVDKHDINPDFSTKMALFVEKSGVNRKDAPVTDDYRCVSML